MPALQPIAPLAALTDSAADVVQLEAILAPADPTEPVAAKAEAVAALVKQIHADGRAKVKTLFEQTRLGGLPAALSLGLLQDWIITLLFRAAPALAETAPPAAAPPSMAVIAVGGYGRGPLAPHSDIDLLFLTPDAPPAMAGAMIQAILYPLWDMRLKVGHASRSMADCLRLAREDMTIRTALLEARHICGDAALTETLRRRLRTELFDRTGPEFVAAKLQERAKRHAKAGASRYLLEPNIKESKGGLRDLQSLLWIARYLHGVHTPEDLTEKRVFSRAETVKFSNTRLFLWTVRFWLHYLTKRPKDQLSFDMQVEIAERMGYRDRTTGRGVGRGVERFMKRYFGVAKEVGDLTRILCADLEETHQVARRNENRDRGRAPFGKSSSLGRRMVGLFRAASPPLSPPLSYKPPPANRLTLADAPETLAADAKPLLALFKTAADTEAPIHPETLRALRRSLRLITPDLRADPEANALFLQTLTSRGDPERALRLMSESGVLGRFMPEFQHIIGMMQFNMYHHYTVDEHTIRAIGELSALEHGERAEDMPISTEIIQGSVNRTALYVAVLLHDIGKGQPEDHSIVGERIAWEVCPRLGLSPSDTEIVAWLVRWHLFMSDVAQKRDLSDAQTIRDFTRVVNSRERLRLLLLLTVCDIRAVGPGVWNGWKAQLLRDLYTEAEAALTGGHSLTNGSRRNRAEVAKAALCAHLTDWSEEERSAYCERHYPAYWLGLPADVHVAHAVLLRNADPRGLALALSPDSDRDATQLCVAIEDHQGLFSRMAGAVAVSGASVVDAKSFTTTDGLALATFWLQDPEGRAYHDTAQLNRLHRSLKRTLSGEIRPSDVLEDRNRARLSRPEAPFFIAPRAHFDNSASELYTVVEVEGRDRLGLLYDLTRVFAEANVKIFSSVVATYGEHAVDVFYVKDLFGHKLSNATKIAHIHKGLIAALQDDGAS